MLKKYIVLMLAVITCSNLVAGCGGTKAVSNNESNKKSELTISTYFPNTYLEEAAKAFEKQNPDVSVKINSFKDYVESIQVEEGQEVAGEDTNANHTLENYITYLNTSFMSNEADDLILLSWLPINKYVESGYLLDLNEMIQKDTELTDEHYYMNVLKGSCYNDTIYAIPMTFGFKMIGINSETLNKSGLKENIGHEDYWNFEKMKQLMFSISDLENKKLYLQSNNAFSLFLNRFELDSGKFISLEKKELNFESDEFISLLKECKELQDKNLLYTGEDENQYSLFSGTMGERYLLTQSKYIGEDSEVNYIKPLINEKDEIAINLTNKLAITKDAKDKELCWKFIKFMLSEKMQLSPEISNITINKMAATEKSKQMIKELVKELKSQKIKLQVTEEEALNDFNNNIEKWTQCPFISYPTDEIRDTVEEEVKPFFEGKKSAEEVAKILQDKLYVMLNE